MKTRVAQDYIEGSTPVSYTHLDVYKRQMLLYTEKGLLISFLSHLCFIVVTSDGLCLIRVTIKYAVSLGN